MGPACNHLISRRKGATMVDCGFDQFSGGPASSGHRAQGPMAAETGAVDGTMPDAAVRAYARATRVLVRALEGAGLGALDRLRVGRAKRTAMERPAAGVMRLMVMADARRALSEEVAAVVDKTLALVPQDAALLAIADDRTRAVWLGEYSKGSESGVEDGYAEMEAELKRLEGLLEERDSEIERLQRELAKAREATDAEDENAEVEEDGAASMEGAEEDAPDPSADEERAAMGL